MSIEQWLSSTNDFKLTEVDAEDDHESDLEYDQNELREMVEVETQNDTTTSKSNKRNLRRLWKLFSCCNK